MSLASSFHLVSNTSLCRVGIVGFGTVGSAVARRLTSCDAVRGVTLSHICDRRAADKQGRLADAGITWTSAIEDLLRSDVDVIVETVGGVDPAAGWIRDALLAGKSVVTANKQVIAREGQPPVMFYNGATADARWRIGWIAFDENYTRVVDRCIEPLLVPPPPKERAGPDIAFAASCLDRDPDILLYYSLEDRLLRRALVRQLRPA